MSTKITKKVSYEIATEGGTSQALNEDELRSKIAEAKARVIELNQFIEEAESMLPIKMGKMVSASGARRTLSEDAKKLYGLLSEPKTIYDLMAESGFGESKARQAMYQLEHFGLVAKNPRHAVNDRIVFRKKLPQRVDEKREEKILSVGSTVDLSALAKEQHATKQLRNEK